MRSVVIPPRPGIASAVGMLDAPIRHDYADSVEVTTATHLAALTQTFATLATRALDDLENPRATTKYQRLVDARYLGQSYELTVSWDADWATQRELFETAHRQHYGFADPDAQLEIVVARLVVTQPQAHGGLESVADLACEVTPSDHRQVYLHGTWREVPIFDRTAFGAGTVVSGPAIIEQFDSTIYVRPDQTATNDTHDFLHIRATTTTGESA